MLCRRKRSRNDEKKEECNVSLRLAALTELLHGVGAFSFKGKDKTTPKKHLRWLRNELLEGLC